MYQNTNLQNNKLNIFYSLIFSTILLVGCNGTSPNWEKLNEQENKYIDLVRNDCNCEVKAFKVKKSNTIELGLTIYKNKKDEFPRRSNLRYISLIKDIFQENQSINMLTISYSYPKSSNVSFDYSKDFILNHTHTEDDQK